MSKYALTFFILLAFGFTSCKKKQNEAAQNSYNEITKLAINGQSDLRLIFDEILRLGAQCANNPSAIYGNCAIITVDSLSGPHVYTIDYGTGCTDARGTVKKGKISVKVQYKYWNGVISEDIRFVSFENFNMNGNRIKGSVYLYWIDDYPGQEFFNLITNLDFSNGVDAYNVNQDTYIEWIGSSTCDINDDEFKISGNLNATNSSSTSVGYTINSPVVWKQNLNFPFHGVFSCEKEKYGNTIILGAGSEHEKATVFTKYKWHELTFNLKNREYE